MEKAVSIPVNAGSCARGFTAALMVSMPNISTAKPMRMDATDWRFSFFENRSMATPMMARTGEKEVGFRSLTRKEELSMPVRLRIQDVIVVPTLAPIMTPTACSNLIMPELTKPTTITVVADED